MNTIIFEAYQDTAQWNGYAVAVVCPGSKLFDTTNSSISSVSTISQYPVCCKAKSVHTLTANFQRLWNKKEEDETFVLDNDIDIVIDSESHLNQGISNSDSFNIWIHCI